jgi:hypothetical protein
MYGTFAGTDYTRLSSLGFEFLADSSWRVPIYSGGTFGASDGSVGSPSFYFTDSPNNGIYRPGGNQVGFVTNGVEAGRFTGARNLVVDNVIRAADGDIAEPTFSFTSDLNTGVYRFADGEIGFSSNGTHIFTIGPTQILSTSPFSGVDGTEAAPGYSFSGAADTGVYRDSGTGALRLSVGGTQMLSVSSGAISGEARFDTINGSAAGPAYAFSGATNTGMYRHTASGDLRLAVSGTQQLSLGSGATISAAPFVTGTTGTAAAPSYAFEANTSTGVYRDNGTGDLALSVNGAQQLTVGSGATLSTSPLMTASNGTASAPAYTFFGNTGTGIYRDSGSGDLALAVAGTQLCTIVTIALLSTPPLMTAANGTDAAPAYTFLANPGTGLYRDNVSGNIGLTVDGTIEVELGTSISGGNVSYRDWAVVGTMSCNTITATALPPNDVGLTAGQFYQEGGTVKVKL